MKLGHVVGMGVGVTAISGIAYISYLGFSAPMCPAARRLTSDQVSLDMLEGCSMTLSASASSPPCTNTHTSMTKVGSAVANSFSLVMETNGSAKLLLNDDPACQVHCLADKGDAQAVQAYLGELANLAAALMRSAGADSPPGDYTARLAKNEVGWWIWMCSECGSTLSTRMMFLPRYLSKHDLLNKSIRIVHRSD